ncbi:hypothetical protein [Lactococcus phage P1046]|uniref:Uncharacterized protein n=1 Tax=Lactococcus phage P1046 TaxID=2662294 RepID=A0A649V1S2_9CAUD|nr:hypothetical protein [Lactococcus phage P1046]
MKKDQPYILPDSVHVVDYDDTICAVKIVNGNKDLEKYFAHIFMNAKGKVVYNKQVYGVDHKHFDYGLPNSEGDMVVYFLAYKEE